MEFIWAIGLVVVNALWLALVAMGLPGNWLMVASAGALTWWRLDAQDGRPMFGLITLCVAVGLALLGELFELLAGAAGAGRAGGTRRGSVGALIGGMLGAVFGTLAIPVPVVGTLTGACGGAFVGACLLELSGGRRMDSAIRSGLGAGVGHLIGVTLKFGIGVIIWMVLAIAAFWP